MKKKLFNMMIPVLAIVISFSAVQAYATSKNELNDDYKVEKVNEFNGNMYEYDKLSSINEWGWSWEAISNYGWPWTAKPKTITKNFNSADVPAAVYYSEYIAGKWYTGTPELTGSVIKLGPTIWQATYTGYINY